MLRPRFADVLVLSLPFVAFAPSIHAGDPVPAAPAPVDFQREVRPILAENCLLCHGPDARDRKSDLRFDEKHSPFRDLGGYAAVVPGKSDRSRLIERVTSADHPMPPPETGKSLSAAQIDVLRRWIDQGAEWKEHWAYIAPVRSAEPTVSDATWPRSAIDRFVMRRLDEAGVRQNPEADRATLLRRATLDLTGLPPTIAELEAFLADPSPDAYERAVDRLLESPRHAERMAKDWLDAARYGDTHGYHLDNERRIWRYRDWVIGAFAKNMPFDQFTIEQLAGDLLPNATLEQQIATGFLRCNPTTAEGGLIEEEYLVKYAVDRAETVSTVWLGTTLGCAQCHDHKYDPFKQTEFYRFYAFFNNIAERGTDENIPNPAPFLKAPTPAQTVELERLDAAIDLLVARQVAPDAALDAAEAEYSREMGERLSRQWRVLEPASVASEGGATLTPQEDGSILPSGVNPERDAYVIEFDAPAAPIHAIRLEALRHDSFVSGGIGRADNSNFVLTDVQLAVAGAGGEFSRIPITGAAADFAQPGYPIRDAIDADPQSGWAIHFQPRDRVATFAPRTAIEGVSRLRLTLRFDSVFPRHAMGRFRISVSADETVAPLGLGPWQESPSFRAENFDAAYATEYAPEASPADAGVKWRDRPDIREGRAVAFSGDLTTIYLRRELEVAAARVVTLKLGSDDAVKVWLNGQRVHENKVLRALLPDSDVVSLALRAGTNSLLVKVVNSYGDFGFAASVEDSTNGELPPAIAAILSRPVAERDAAQNLELKRHYRSSQSEAWKTLESERLALVRERTELESAIPTTLVAAEATMRRQAHLLMRGQYDRKAEAVEPGTPSVLPPLEVDGAPDRLALARWLVAKDNPLTARVTVNRLWQRFFGSGLVETIEDFGVRGASPSHPELLDWLAVDFVEAGFDVRRLIRSFVTSATYRQSAATTAAQIEGDPKNRLLGRGPRFRLDAEAIRDSMLYVSGLLVERVGGPSVKPYQPDGIWQAVAYPTSNTAQYLRDNGDGLYRRSLYTFWKRTAPPASLATFDAPSRESCCVERPITNTPLQALALMNDVQYVEAARAFAQRILNAAAADDDGRLALAFRTATSRSPRAGESVVLRDLLAAQRAEYAAAPDAARALLAHGESPRDERLEIGEHAAWTVIANLLLNLDETIMRG
jgi:Protein of unknown function (DUF1553)/Protein of unknown function (DUF1549)/Planctomycete cytochrome C